MKRKDGKPPSHRGITQPAQWRKHPARVHPDDMKALDQTSLLGYWLRRGGGFALGCSLGLLKAKS